MSEVYIPNYEIRGEFANAVEEAKWTEVMNSIQRSEKLLKATWEMNEELVAEYINISHDEYTSVIKYNDENSLACVLAIAYYNAVNYYTKVLELPIGKRYADIVLRFSQKLVT